MTLNRTAFLATVHCLTGCAIGEVLGMVIGTAFAFPVNRWLIARGRGHPSCTPQHAH